MFSLSKLSPSITDMIRMDHSHVLLAFHQYTGGAKKRVKKALTTHICTALEIHAHYLSPGTILASMLCRFHNDRVTLQGTTFIDHRHEPPSRSRPGIESYLVAARPKRGI